MPLAAAIPKHFLEQNKHSKSVCEKNVGQVVTPNQMSRGLQTTQMHASRAGTKLEGKGLVGGGREW